MNGELALKHPFYFQHRDVVPDTFCQAAEIHRKLSALAREGK
jgi:hypothetical protein